MNDLKNNDSSLSQFLFNVQLDCLRLNHILDKAFVPGYSFHEMMNANQRDIHILRYFSSFISVADKQVINVTDPILTYCPLAGHLYKGLKNIDGADKNALKLEIKRIIEDKIRKYGFFTARRELFSCDPAIPYGASEMMMFALKKKNIDAAVIVCDGAGTIVTNNEYVVQGIGARMNTLLLTSPIKELIARLKEVGCDVVFENALIDQVRGVDEAIKTGYRKITVTVNGHDSEKLKEIRQLESSSDATVTILIVCTTGITGMKVDEIRRYADIVWSCASSDIRYKIGKVSLLQVSKQIPVFILTKSGIDFFSAYADDSSVLRDLDNQKQYLISHEPVGEMVKFGNFYSFLREEKLPVLSEKGFAMQSS